MSFQKIVEDIKNLKIQGAQNIAKSAIQALNEYTQKTETKTKEELIKKIITAKKTLFETRPTEPFLRNTLNYLFYNLKGEDTQELKTSMEKNTKELLGNIEKDEENTANIGARKIKNEMIIFTHCHSSTVTNILKQAWKEGKRFTVHNTETRPRFQGRKTATELAQHGIPVEFYVDSAARFALKKADIMLIGADAITTEGIIINKIGSEMFAEIAHNKNIPVYSCTHSWKFDPLTVFGYEEEIEKKAPNEIWENPPKGVRINNYAFEKISPDLITGIISEIGIYKPETFVEELKKRNGWMF